MNRTSRLLIDESPLQVLPSLAQKIGLDLAVVLQQIHYLTREAIEGCYNDNGVIWIKRTAEEWRETFKFWSVPTIRRILKKLAKLKAIKTSTKFNKVRTDRTLWYTVDHDSLDASDQVDHMGKSDVKPDITVLNGIPLPSDQVDHMIISTEDSIQEKDSLLSETKKSDKKSSPKKARLPGADLTDAMFKAIPTEIRPPKPEYMRHYRKAEELFSAGHTPEQVFDFVDWKYATNDWMWTGSDGTPVIINMGMVANNIKAASGKVKEWIAEGRPRRTQRAQESAKVEKPFDPETDPDNPKNWPKGLTPSPEAIARYAQFVADKMKENANGHTQLYQPGGKDLLPAGTGTTPVAAGQPGQLDLPLVSGHGSGDRERTG